MEKEEAALDVFRDQLEIQQLNLSAFLALWHRYVELKLGALAHPDEPTPPQLEAVIAQVVAHPVYRLRYGLREENQDGVKWAMHRAHLLETTRDILFTPI